MALFIFQFGLLQPIASMVNSQSPIALFTLLLTIIALVVNKFQIKKYVIIILISISLIFLLNSILHSNLIDSLMLYIEFLAKGFSAIYIASLKVDEDHLLNAFTKLALFNFFAIFLYPFLDIFDSMNYMRFGYAMIPSLMMFFYAYKKSMKSTEKFIWLLLFVASIILTILYGSRGSVVVLTIFILLLTLFSNKVTGLKKIAIITTFSIFLLLLFLNTNLIGNLINFLNKNLGINSYALVKFEKMFNEGLRDSSSGRDVIYSNLFNLFKESPFFGQGIGSSQVHLGFTAHNILLQILVETGSIGLIIWFLIWLYLFGKYKLLTKFGDSSYFKISTLLIAASFGRLLVSSDMWLRPEYWFLISLLLNVKVRSNQKFIRGGKYYEKDRNFNVS